MVAVVRNLDADEFGRLDHIQVGAGLNFLAIDRELGHLFQ